MAATTPTVSRLLIERNPPFAKRLAPSLSRIGPVADFRHTDPSADGNCKDARQQHAVFSPLIRPIASASFQKFGGLAQQLAQRAASGDGGARIGAVTKRAQIARRHTRPTRHRGSYSVLGPPPPATAPASG